jgi:hypothetical protein
VLGICGQHFAAQCRRQIVLEAAKLSRRSSGLESGDAASSSKRGNANAACWLELISRLSLLFGAIPVLARASRNRAWRREMNRGGGNTLTLACRTPDAARHYPLPCFFVRDGKTGCIHSGCDKAPRAGQWLHISSCSGWPGGQVIVATRMCAVTGWWSAGADGTRTPPSWEYANELVALPLLSKER